MGNKYWFLFWRVISCYLLLIIRLQEEVFATGIQDCWSWKWPLDSIVSNTPAQKPVFSSSLFRVKSRWDLNIPKDRDLQHGQSVWHLTAHTRNLIFLGLHGIFSVWICALCLLPWAPLRKVQLCLPYSHIRYLYTWVRCFWTFSFQLKSSHPLSVCITLNFGCKNEGLSTNLSLALGCALVQPKISSLNSWVIKGYLSCRKSDNQSNTFYH